MERDGFGESLESPLRVPRDPSLGTVRAKGKQWSQGRSRRFTDPTNLPAKGRTLGPRETPFVSGK